MTTTSEPSPPSLWHRRFRLAWYPVAVLAIGILLAAIPGYLFFNPLGVFEDRLVLTPSTQMQWLINLVSLVSFVTGMLSIGLAILLFAKKSSDRMGLFLSYYLLSYGIVLAGPIEQLQYIWPAAPWINSLILIPFLVGPLTLALVGIFPNGQFVPRWSRWLAPLTFLTVPFAALTGVDLSEIEFPLVAVILLGGGALLSVGLVVSAGYAQIYRYRRISSPAERQQVKIVLYGILLWFSFMSLSSVAWILGFNLPLGSPAPWWLLVGSLIWSTSTLLLPAALTLAVLRYKLFEIELLVNKTLVYGLLTGLLALLYFSLVTLLQNLLSALTGQQSAVAIVVSTLVIAALFNPLRRRIQDFIDRRFYRRGYDAEQMLASFNLAVRDEVDLDSLSKTLLAVVDETMQPVGLSLWLVETSEQGPDPLM